MNLSFNKAIFLLLFYALFLVVFSSEILLREYVNARRELLVESASTSTIKTVKLSNNYWKQLKNKDEFFINGQYYDLVSFKEHKAYVLAQVVVDDFEIVLKKTIHNLTHKTSKHKKNVSSLFINLFWCTIFEWESTGFYSIYKKHITNACFTENNYLQKIFQPPRFFNLLSNE